MPETNLNYLKLRQNASKIMVQKLNYAHERCTFKFLFRNKKKTQSNEFGMVTKYAETLI
jgi:hypothetical protein